MNDQIKALRQQLGDVVHEMRAMLDAAEAEGRGLTAEEEAKWQRMSDDVDELEKRIDRLTQLREQERLAAEATREIESVVRPAAEDARPSGEDELRAFLRGERREHVVKLSGLSVARPQTGGFEVRDLTRGTAGETTPTEFRRQLYEHLVEVSAIRQTNVTVFTTDSGNQILIPKTTAHPGASAVAEGAALPENDPTFGQVALDAYKFGALVDVSRELIEDNAVNLVDYLARAVAQAIGNAAGAKYILGSGTNEPRGVLTNATVGVTGAAQVPTADELIDLYFSVIGPYRRNAYWLLSDAALRDIRKLKDSQNQYIWQPGLAGSQPNQILDRPYITDPNMPAPAAGAMTIAFGDFSAFAIRDVGEVRFERSDEFRFGNELISFRASLRTDSDYLDETGAIKVFQAA